MDYSNGCFIGRVWHNEKGGPCLIKVKDGFVYDITSKEIPTVRDLLELDDIPSYLNHSEGQKLISIENLFTLSLQKIQMFVFLHHAISRLLKLVELLLLNLW